MDAEEQLLRRASDRQCRDQSLNGYRKHSVLRDDEILDVETKTTSLPLVDFFR